MEIHAPEGPILSTKEFLVHIGVVTIGILIALSLEGLIEWNHHRHLVGEARENIRAEIEDNQREMAGHLRQSSKIKAEHQTVLHWISDMQGSHDSSIRALNISFSLAELSRSSWTTAQTVGALGLMDYHEVKRDAAVYELQDEFLRLQSRAEDAAVVALVFLSPGEDPGRMSSADLAEEKKRIQASLATIRAQEQIGTQLQKRYAEWLKEK